MAAASSSRETRQLTGLDPKFLKPGTDAVTCALSQAARFAACPFQPAQVPAVTVCPGVTIVW